MWQVIGPFFKPGVDFTFSTGLHIEEGVKPFLHCRVLHVDLTKWTVSACTATALPSLKVGILREHLVPAGRVNIHLLPRLTSLSMDPVDDHFFFRDAVSSMTWGRAACHRFTEVCIGPVSVRIDLWQHAATSLPASLWEVRYWHCNKSFIKLNMKMSQYDDKWFARKFCVQHACFKRLWQSFKGSSKTVPLLKTK